MFGRRRSPERAPTPAGPAVSAEPAEALLRRLEWTVVRRLDGVLQGDYRTLWRGFGLELADLREYQPGDDVRHIDWNASARLHTAHVRTFQEDREVCAWFLVDLTGSVDFGSGPRPKRAVAMSVTAVLARLLVRHGNRVGALLYAGDGACTAVPARGGRRQVLHLLHRMGQTPATGQRATRLSNLLTQALSLLGPRSVVFVISDFISEPGWERPLGLLAQRHDVVAVRMHDPLEAALPDLGVVVLQDAETGEQMLVDTHDAGFRRRFAEAARAREAGLRRALADAGVDALELGTDEALDTALVHFARQRRRRGLGHACSGGAASPRLTRP